jgi:hypothetical protein
MATQLPTIKAPTGKTYYIDDKLSQLRNVNNPHDFAQFKDPVELQTALLVMRQANKGKAQVTPYGVMLQGKSKGSMLHGRTAQHIEQVGSLLKEAARRLEHVRLNSKAINVAARQKLGEDSRRLAGLAQEYVQIKRTLRR